MEEVKVVHEGKEYKVHVGKITYAQRNQILESSTETIVEGGKTIAKINYPKLERGVLLASIKKVAPDVADIGAFIDSLELDEAQKIIDVALRLNPLQT